jgi:hypothetical protein
VDALITSANARSYRKPYGAFSYAPRHGRNFFVAPNTGPTLHKYKGWTNILDDTINWPHPENGRVEKSLYDARSLKEWNIPKLKDASYEAHLRVFKEKLAFWEKILDGRRSFMPPIEVAKRSILLGPEFPKSIKDAIEHNLRYHTSFIDDAVFDDIDESAWGHDYFFSPRDCINFRIPEDNADIERLLTEPPPIDPDVIAHFKTIASENIEAPPHRVDLDDLDRLGMFTQTSVFDDPSRKSGKSRHTNYLSRLGKVIKGCDVFKFEYVPVQKNAAETRAAVVASPETLVEIKRFHKMFKAVAKCPEDHYSDPTVLDGLEAYLSCGYSRRVGYLMSDIRKSGLTFNRNLHNALIEVLHAKMPAWGWDRYRDFGQAEIFLPYRNSWHRIKNGYGLGIMDCVISFTQAIVFQMWRERHPWEGYHLSGKFWSDDSVVKVRTSSDHDIDDEKMQDILDSYNGFYTECGIVIHGEKPYFSKKGVFLETYGTHYKYPWDHATDGQYIG